MSSCKKNLFDNRWGDACKSFHEIILDKRAQMQSYKSASTTSDQGLSS